MEYGKLYIIPDENKVLGGIFHKNISNNYLILNQKNMLYGNDKFHKKH